jgi:CRP-like cAMP-binding protein
MEKARRTGFDRRSFLETSHDDKRRGADRRMLSKHSADVIDILDRIPVFRGLSDNQLKKILSICSKQVTENDEVICRSGDGANTMYILLKGSLQVTFSDGRELSRIEPIGIVGEMGVFTGEKRSATVVSEEKSILLIIHKTELFRIFRHDGELGIQVLMNVVQDLAQKLQKNNIFIEELSSVCSPEDYDTILEKIQSHHNKT